MSPQKLLVQCFVWNYDVIPKKYAKIEDTSSREYACKVSRSNKRSIKGRRDAKQEVRLPLRDSLSTLSVEIL